MNLQHGKQTPDPVEQWLKETLEPHHPEAPADAWDRLEPFLPAKRKRRLMFLWFFCFITGATIAWIKQYDIYSTSAPEKVADPGQGVYQEPLQAASIMYTSVQPAALTVTPAPANSMVRTDRVIAPPAPAVSFDYSSAPIHNAGQQTGKDTIFSRPAANPPLSVEVASLLPARQILHSNAISRMFRKKTVLAHVDPPQLRRPDKGWMLAWAVSPVLLDHRETSTEATQRLVFPEDAERFSSGWQAGLNLGYQTRKGWRFNLGLHRMAQTRVAVHQATLRLMDGVCLNPDDPGLKKYEFQYSVVANEQRSDLTLRLEQEHDSVTMHPDEPFILDMSTRRHSVNWRIPFTVERQFGKGPWTMYAQTGFAVDIPGRSHTTVTHFTEICEDLCFTSKHEPEIEQKNTTNSTFIWIAGVGIERRLSTHASLRLEPSLLSGKHMRQWGLGLSLLRRL